MIDAGALSRMGLAGRDTVHLVAAETSAEPGGAVQELLSALLARRAASGDPAAIRLYRGMSLSPVESIPDDPAIRVRSAGLLGSNRPLWERGQLDLIPEGVRRFPGLLRDGRIGNDAFLVRVTRVAGGGFSTGLVNDYIPAALESTGAVVAELTENYPVLPGAVRIEADRIDALVERSDGPPEFVASPGKPEDEAIASRVADLIDDGDCIQLGLGGLGEAIARALAERRRDLGLHTGLIDDAMLALIDSGAVTNARKEIDTGQSVTPLVMGSADLYRKVAGRTDLLLRPVDHTNDPATIARIGRFAAINSAVQVDLLGQVNAESLNGRRLSAAGGQLDFCTGARLSPGGKVIVVVRATAAGGSISRIVPSLPDSVVTVGTGQVDFVVTEYGVADLRGATLDERAQRLTAIAHPDFRAGLATAADADLRLVAYERDHPLRQTPMEVGQ